MYPKNIHRENLDSKYPPNEQKVGQKWLRNGHGKAPRHGRIAPNVAIRLCRLPAASLGKSPIKWRKTNLRLKDTVRGVARGGEPIG